MGTALAILARFEAGSRRSIGAGGSAVFFALRSLSVFAFAVFPRSAAAKTMA